MNRDDTGNTGRTFAQNKDCICKADGFGKVMSDQDDSPSGITDDLSDVVSYRKTGLIIQCRKRFIQK